MTQLNYVEVSSGYYKLTQIYSAMTGITGHNINLLSAGIELTADGQLMLFNHYHFDGVTGAPDIPPHMRAAAEHDAFFRMFQLGVLPLAYFDKVALRFKQVIIEDQKAILPEGVEYRDNPYSMLVWSAVTSDIARRKADPANYTEPKVLVSPDPDWLEDDA